MGSKTDFSGTATYGAKRPFVVCTNWLSRFADGPSSAAHLRNGYRIFVARLRRIRPSEPQKPDPLALTSQPCVRDFGCERHCTSRVQLRTSNLRFKGLLLSDDQPLIPRPLFSADRAYKHGGSSVSAPSALLYRERIMDLPKQNLRPLTSDVLRTRPRTWRDVRSFAGCPPNKYWSKRR
jgi:hypothetical protein